MKPVPAVVESAVDIAKLSTQWELACGAEQRAETSLAEARLKKGRILVEARKAFPARGPKAKGWGELLAKWNIDQQRAWEYMRLAGYMETVSPPSGEIPTQAEAGIRDRAAESGSTEEREDEDGDPDWDKINEHARATLNKAITEEEVDDPEQYRIAYLIRAEQAVKFADMTLPLLKEFYRLSPRRKKDHSELVGWARRVADAWMKLATKLENDQ